MNHSFLKPVEQQQQQKNHSDFFLKFNVKNRCHFLDSSAETPQPQPASVGAGTFHRRAQQHVAGLNPMSVS